MTFNKSWTGHMIKPSSLTSKETKSSTAPSQQMTCAELWQYMAQQYPFWLGKWSVDTNSTTPPPIRKEFQFTHKCLNITNIYTFIQTFASSAEAIHHYNNCKNQLKRNAGRGKQQIVQHLKPFIAKHNNRGFTINQIHADNKCKHIERGLNQYQHKFELLGNIQKWEKEKFIPSKIGAGQQYTLHHIGGCLPYQLMQQLTG